MSTPSIIGRVHSLQSLGTVDGPGIRFVAFLQGCPLRCGCCHNPDTWDPDGGKEYTTEEILDRVCRYRSYFGRDGGITLSGGEPLLQPDFVTEVFRRCREKQINTCLDTSGGVLSPAIDRVLEYTDRVLLDIKYTNDGDYRAYVGCSIDKPLRFLKELNRRKIPTTLRQVIIPTLNDTPENIKKLKVLADSHPCVDKLELLPFRKICQVKYDQMKIDFPFSHIPEPSPEKMRELEQLLKKA